MTIKSKRWTSLEGIVTGYLLDRVAEAILEEMDITDGLDAPSARRYAKAAIKQLEKDGALKK